MQTKITTKQLAAMIDFSALKANVTPADVKRLCANAKKYRFYAVDINSCYIKLTKRLLKNSGVKIIGMVGYPLGANSTSVKVFEARQAIKDGADELDMVMNIGRFKARDYGYVKKEIASVVKVAKGRPVKVIIETGFLTPKEIVKASKLVKIAGASFVKGSTGMGPKGANVRDTRLMRKAVGPKFGVKAAGGIVTAKQAFDIVKAGASRLGISAAVEIMEELKKKR